MRPTPGGPEPATTPPVFIADRPSLQRDLVVLSGTEGRHAATVRRLRPGERVDLTDGAGMMAECVVAGAGPGRLELTVLRRRVAPPPEPRICVVQAVPKGERGEQAVQTMTEIGVDVIVPWAAQRCVPSWATGGGRPAGPGEAAARPARALERWRATAREAAKQSRRDRIPEVTGLAATGDVLGRAELAAAMVVLAPGAAVRLGSLPLPATGEIMLIVGPEGGLSEAEAGTFQAAGAVLARLGPTVLRSSTAGTAAAAVLLSRCGRW